MSGYQSDWVVGIDLGDRKSHVCRLNTRTGEILEGRIPTKPKSFSSFFRTLETRLVAMEVGTHSRWASQLLEQLGHRVLVANPRKLQLIAKSNSKNDRADAELLTRLAAADPKLLSPIKHRGEKAHADLALLKARDGLVRTRTGLVNQVRGLVKPAGARLPKCSTVSFPKKVQASIPAALVPAINPLLLTIDSISQQIRNFDKKIAEISVERYPETQFLKQVRGVGPITSLAFVLIIENPNRFKKSRAVGAYLGMRPRQDESGQIRKQLRITKAGDTFLRRLLVQCAHYMLGPFGEDCDLRRWGLAIAQRGGVNAKKRAGVAVARKLSVLLHRLWVTRAEYEPLRHEQRRQLARDAG